MPSTYPRAWATRTVSRRMQLWPMVGDREAWGAGLKFAWDAFAIGAAYKIDNKGVGGDGMSGDTTVLDLGFTYTTGPWVLGFNYGHLEQEVPANTGDDELDGFALTANYSMGQGINLIAALKYYDYDSSVRNRYARRRRNRTWYGGRFLN